MPDSRSTSEAAMNPLVSFWSLSSTSVSSFSLAICACSSGFLDDQVGRDADEVMPRHRQVALALVEHEVDEQRVVVRQRTDQVVLLAERDQDVVDLIREAE